MIIFSLLSSIILSIGSFTWGYIQAGFNGTAQWIIAFGVVWLIAIWQKWRWVSSAAVLLALPFALFGLWFNFIAGWMFSGMIFALIAWDLTEFQKKMIFMPAREDVKGMQRRHLARVSFLALSGMLIASYFMFRREQLTYDWGLMNLIVLGLGLLQVAAWLRR